jgi:hypothetical protein
MDKVKQCSNNNDNKNNNSMPKQSTDLIIIIIIIHVYLRANTTARRPITEQARVKERNNKLIQTK